MPAFESRRVRTQPFTVTGASCGALPAKIQRTLNTLSSIDRELSLVIRARDLSRLPHGSNPEPLMSLWVKSWHFEALGGLGC
jgi:hypothetical protein